MVIKVSLELINCSFGYSIFMIKFIDFFYPSETDATQKNISRFSEIHYPTINYIIKFNIDQTVNIILDLRNFSVHRTLIEKLILYLFLHLFTKNCVFNFLVQFSTNPEIIKKTIQPYLHALFTTRHTSQIQVNISPIGALNTKHAIRVGWWVIKEKYSQ